MVKQYYINYFLFWRKKREKEREREPRIQSFALRFDLDFINNPQPFPNSRFKAMNPIVRILLRFDLDFNWNPRERTRQMIPLRIHPRSRPNPRSHHPITPSPLRFKKSPIDDYHCLSWDFILSHEPFQDFDFLSQLVITFITMTMMKVSFYDLLHVSYLLWTRLTNQITHYL